MRIIAVTGCILLLSLCLVLPTACLADIQDPELASSALWSDARAVRVIDDTAIMLFTRGMATFDVSDPTTPVLLARFDQFDDPWACMGLEVDGDLAYVAAGAAGLKIYSFSDPTHPKLLGECDTPGSAYNLTLVGELAIIADGYEGGVQVVDISDPTAPELLGGCVPHGESYAVAANDEYVYSAQGMTGIAIVEITDPSDPQVVGMVYDTYFPPYAIDIEGDCIYTLGSEGSKTTWDPSGMVIHDISDPTAPSRRGVYHSDQGTNSVSVRGNLAYIANANGTVSVVDVSTSHHPFEVAEVETGGYSSDIHLVENRAYVSASRGCLAILDIGMSTVPVLLGNWWESSGSYDVSSKDGLVCVADLYFGLHLVDASDPEDPFVLSHFELPARVTSVVNDGCYAYVAADTAGVLVIDVMNPKQPITVGQVDVRASDLDLDGDYLYAVARDDKLYAIDVIDPQKPELLGSVDIPGSSWSISVSGRYGCLTTGTALNVVDVGDPTNPVMRGLYDPSSWEYIRRVSFDGTYAYISLGNNGLFVIDVSDPDDPTYVNELRFDGNTRGSCLAGDRLYLGAAGLQVIDISDPENPSVVGSAKTTGTQHICVDSGFAFSADGGSLGIFRLFPVSSVEESAVVRLGGGPELVLENPVLGGTEILIRLANEDPIRLDVLDVQGRRAALLHDGRVAARDLRLRWEAATLPSGRYYLRASTPGGETIRPVLVIR